jgi:uncharacterized protein DUF6913
MFLKFLKNFLLKRKLKKSLSNVKNNFNSGTIKTVGLLIDESYFNNREALIAVLIDNGIQQENINVLAYKDKIRKNEQFHYPVFSIKDIDWNGAFTSEAVAGFIDTDFDLLISYYDIEKAPLLFVTQRSKAAFKTGFSTTDKRLNHFMITTVAENHEVFIQELFRYLKILNKI